MLSLMFFCFLYGFSAGVGQLPPHDLLVSTLATTHDLMNFWRNDFGFRPTRHLVRGHDGKPGFDAIDPAGMAPGNRLIAGLSANRNALNGAFLFDETGREIHYWPLDYEALDPGDISPFNVFLHGTEPFEDGSLVVNFDAGNVLARIGPCGDILWRNHGPFHHAVSRSHDGSIWTLLGDGIAQVDPETGEVLRNISILDDIILAHGLHGLLAIRSIPDENDLILQTGDQEDAFHTNDVEVLPPDLAAAFPQFSTGDLLVSMRNLNLVAVIDPDSNDVKWWQIGPWFRQHDADFLPDGRISLFDNNMSFGQSQIVRTDPRTGDHEIAFEGSPSFPFYSWIRGTHETLENGNLLVTDSQAGRAFEVSQDGKIVWQFNNAYDDEWNGVLNKAVVLPPDFFEPGVFDCDN